MVERFCSRVAALSPRMASTEVFGPLREGSVLFFSALLPQTRSFGIKARNRGNVYVTRKEARKTLEKATKRHPDSTLLLPPYVSASELRVLFKLDYAGVFRLLGVRRAQSKYFWRDHEGREFETATKRKVMVPFEIAAIPAASLGYRAKVLDVEPDWDVATGRGASRGPVPVVAVLGHINHGKTTLLDTLCGTGIAASEPGSITQEVRAMTGELLQVVSDANFPRPLELERLGSRQPLVSLGALAAQSGILREDTLAVSDAAARNDSRYNMNRITFLDTPGHEAFELHRGRTMAAADVAVVVVSVERGAEMQTDEVLMHASRWKVPIIFALNKIDLPDADIQLTRAELRRQCQRLHEKGLVDVDWTHESENAVPISALRGWHLDELLDKIHKRLDELPSVPLRPVLPPTRTPGEARQCKDMLRRTDFLVGIEAPPLAVAVVVEFERGAEQGEHVLTLLIKSGRLLVGQFFVVGTAFGRITNLSIADGTSERCWKPCQVATSGVAVQVMGIRTRFGGDCAADDLFFALPAERAWRLSEHRRRIEALTALQTAGPEIDVPWEHDSLGMGSRTQAGFERSRHDHPEKHAATAYERRWAQPAIEESMAVDGDIEPSRQSSGIFSTASRRSFGDPLQMTTRAMDANLELGTSIGADYVEAMPSVIQGGGRRSTRKIAVDTEAPQRAKSDQRNNRFRVLMPEEDVDSRGNVDEQGDTQSATSGGGRKSRRADAAEPALAASGAWTHRTRGAGTPKEDFVYYTERQTWTEEAEIDSTRVRARWQDRDEARWQEEQRQAELRAREQALAESTRRQVFGEQEPAVSGDFEAEESRHDFDDTPVEPLPRKNVRVVSMILKTKSVGQFDVLMDEVDRLQDEYGVRVVIVHGGLGPVIAKDVVHAEVEKQYGFCPIYAFQVGVHPVAAGHAEKEQIDVRRFDVFTELIADVASRCDRVNAKEEIQAYTEALGKQAAWSTRYSP